MLVGDLLQLYTRNAPVALSIEFTHEYEFFDQAGKVPKHLRDKEARHIDGQSMREDHGITIWYKP